MKASPRPNSAAKAGMKLTPKHSQSEINKQNETVRNTY